MSNNLQFLDANGLNKYHKEAVEKKVDKVEGKQLSTNDFTDEYKDKLENINLEAGTGNNSIVQKNTGSVATGENAIALGEDTKAYQRSSFAIGRGTQAGSNYEEWIQSGVNLVPLDNISSVSNKDYVNGTFAFSELPAGEYPTTWISYRTIPLPIGEYSWEIWCVDNDTLFGNNPKGSTFKVENKNTEYTISDDLSVPLDGHVFKLMCWKGSTKPTIDDFVPFYSYEESVSYGAAVGYKTKALGWGTFTAGRETVASDNGAAAFGFGGEANGKYSLAAGDHNIAQGHHSFAHGQENKANGYGSHAEGLKTTTQPEDIEEGKVSRYSHTEGIETKTYADYAHAEGTRSTASGTASHAEGDNTQATAAGAHSEGRNTQATNTYAHSEGTDTIASGTASHAEGSGTTAAGANSHAEGFKTYAGFNAHAEGYRSRANAQASHASGLGCTTKEVGQTALGRGNVEGTSGALVVGIADYYEYAKDKQLYITGNVYKNGFIVDWDGNGWFAGAITCGPDNQKIATQNWVKEYHSSNWSDKKWLCIGDSITQRNSKANKYYYDIIKEHTGIQVTVDAAGGVGYLDGGTNNFYNKIISRNDFANYDVITIFGSFNDGNLSAPTNMIGEYNDRTISDNSPATLCSAINLSLDHIIKQNPSIQICLVTPTPWFDEPEKLEYWRHDYVDAIINICHNRGIPCLDLFHNSNLHPTLDTNNIIYPNINKDGSKDFVHFGDKGHKMIASRFKAMLDTLLI